MVVVSVFSTIMITRAKGVAVCLLTLFASVPVVLEARTAAALSPTFGWIDSVTVQADETIVVQGWAATADFPTVALGVRVQIDGQLVLPSFRIANEYRPDVGAAYPGYGNYHGFQFTVPAPWGTHIVKVEAQNSGVYNLLSGSVVYSMADNPGMRFWGGSYPASPGDVITKYWYRYGTTFDWQIDTAMAAWDATNTNLSLARTTNINSSKLRIGVQYTSGVDWTGITDAIPCANSLTIVNLGCTYDYSEITLNSKFLTGNNNYIQKTMAHESGHAFGLYHTPLMGSVMNSLDPASPTCGGSCPVGPSSYDTTSINILYPRTWLESI